MNTLKLNFGEPLSREKMRDITGGVVWCRLTDGSTYACGPSGTTGCATQCADAFGDECFGCYEVIT